MATKKFKLSTSEVIKNADFLFHRARWNYGIVVCPYCGSIHIKEYDGYKYKCNSCKNRFSDKTNTLMHGSKLSVSVWMQAVYELSINNFTSSTVLATKLGINQKSAWLLMTKLRYSMKQDKVLLGGMIAQDEMYIGGCLSNFHYSRKWDLLRKGNYIKGDEERYSKRALFSLNSDLKQPVFGMTNGDKVVLYATPNPIKKEYIRKIYKKHAVKGTPVVSDESGLYNDWKKFTGSDIYMNNHHNNQYTTKEGYTSNRIENRFSWYKRGFNGTITHCKYHQLYLNEFAFRYNHRGLSTEEMFKEILGGTIGKHVTYKQIRNYTPERLFISKEKQKKMEIKDRKRMKLYGWALENGIMDSVTYQHKIYTKDNLDI